MADRKDFTMKFYDQKIYDQKSAFYDNKVSMFQSSQFYD